MFDERTLFDHQASELLRLEAQVWCDVLNHDDLGKGVVARLNENERKGFATVVVDAMAALHKCACTASSPNDIVVVQARHEVYRALVALKDKDLRSSAEMLFDMMFGCKIAEQFLADCKTQSGDESTPDRESLRGMLDALRGFRTSLEDLGDHFRKKNE